MAPSNWQKSNATWPVDGDRDELNPAYVESVDRLADAARDARWDSVFQMLDEDSWCEPNSWRIGGKSWYTPLHQAAWHGADPEVAERLITLGAWRNLRDSTGKRPVDIAKEHEHAHLLEVLAAADVGPHDRRKYDAWDGHLAALVAERTRELPAVRFHPPATELVVLEKLDSLWFAYPGMYGGFALSMFKERLLVESWSRAVGGSGQAHVITESGCVLVEEGFI